MIPRRTAGVLLLTAVTGVPAAAQPLTFAAPDQFLVDKEMEVTALVKVARVESRWIFLEHDHIPISVVDCAVEAILAGDKAWAVGSSVPVVQFDHSDMIGTAIAPTAIEGRRYLLWASSSGEKSEVAAAAPWTAHPKGFLLIRKQGDQEFVFWNGKAYLVSAIRARLEAATPLPLDRIVDPLRRLNVAEARLERGNVGDEQAFIHGLVLNIVDAEGQAERVEQPEHVDPDADPFGMSAGGGQPHALWYNSLALLRDFGKASHRRAKVVAALAPIAKIARPRIRLAVALALVDLGSAAGRTALIAGFNSESGPVSSDPPDDMTFPGRYPYDESSITASAHALARLGDRRGLKHPKAEVRLAAAEAFRDAPDPELTKVLETLATELEPEIETLKAKGELTKRRDGGDYTVRYPPNWVRTHALRARFGDENSLRRLVDAYVADFETYPEERRPLLPTARPVMSSVGPALGEAIQLADASPARLLERLRPIVTDRARWNSAPMTALRASLDDPTAAKPAERAEKKPDRADIARLLGDSNPNRRAEGLAAAGYHRLFEFYDQAVDVAVHGSGAEQSAAIYALGFYGRDVSDDTLRRLMTSGDAAVRLSGLELATRKSAARFAREVMDVVRALTSPDATGSSDRDRRAVSALPRFVARLARGPLPAPLLEGLADRQPEVRRIVVQALGLAGNPDAVPALQPIADDADVATREAARRALRALGPPDRP